MTDCLLSHLGLAHRASYQLTHLLPAVQDRDGLLVLVGVDLHLVDQLLVHQLVLADHRQQPVQLAV